MRMQHWFYKESKERTAQIEEEIELERTKMTEEEYAAETERTRKEASELLSSIKRKEQAKLSIPNKDKMRHFLLLAQLAVIFAHWARL